MASFWKHKYFREAWLRDLDECLKDKTNEHVNAAIKVSKGMLTKLEEDEIAGEQSGQQADKFEDCLNTLIAAFDFARLKSTDPENKLKMKMVEMYLDSLTKCCKLVFLSGEWISLGIERKKDLVSVLETLLEQVPSRKTLTDGFLTLSQEPWGDEAVKKLISGKFEKEEEVLALLSAEGVEGILVRIEMLVESMLEKQAYKASAAVVHSLIAEDMILQSYACTSPPGTVERLIDIFMALSVLLDKTSRLYKVLKTLGLEEVYSVYMKRFDCYMNNKLDPNQLKEDAKEEYATSDSHTQCTDVQMTDLSNKQTDNDKTSAAENIKTEEIIPTASTSSSSHTLNNTKSTSIKACDDNNELDREKFKQLEKGRCHRLFSESACAKVLEVIFQWSLAGAAVKETNDSLQMYLLSEWFEKNSANREKLLDDADMLMECATQTPFLYTMANLLYTRFGKEVQVKVIRMFVRALNTDINQYEAAKRNKTSKTSMEGKLSKGFTLLSEIVAETPALCRECVLTAFSIKPQQKLLNRIEELAKLSVLHQEENDDVDSEGQPSDAEEITDLENSGLHCRVTYSVDESEKKFQKSYHQTLKLKKSAKPFNTLLGDLNDLTLERINKLTDSFLVELGEKKYTAAPTKLRNNKSCVRKKVRNLEGLISIRGELVTEAANYNPLDAPCVSLQPETLNLPPTLTDDLLTIISAPRWHMLSWVMSWRELHKACTDLLENPTLREPIEDLKYLNIDYTQFNGWSSDEEVTIFTGIEKGYETWLLNGPDNEGAVSEHEISSDEEAVSHHVDWEDYDNVDKYLVPEDYLRLFPHNSEGSDEKVGHNSANNKRTSRRSDKYNEGDQESDEDEDEVEQVKPAKRKRRKASWNAKTKAQKQEEEMEAAQKNSSDQDSPAEEEKPTKRTNRGKSAKTKAKERSPDDQSESKSERKGEKRKKRKVSSDKNE